MFHRYILVSNNVGSHCGLWQRFKGSQCGKSAVEMTRTDALLSASVASMCVSTPDLSTDNCTRLFERLIRLGGDNCCIRG